MKGMQMEEKDTAIVGHLLYVATVVAKKLGLEKGYRIVINEGTHGCNVLAIASFKINY